MKREYRKILRSIKTFFKCYEQLRNSYSEATISIDPKSLGIHYIKVINNKIFITLEKPGVLIGVRGTTYDNLTNYLKKKLSRDIEILIKEKIRIILRGPSSEVFFIN